MSSDGTTPQQVIGALEAHGCKPRRSGDGWKSKCPSHDGKSQSLSIGDEQHRQGGYSTVLQGLHL